MTSETDVRQAFERIAGAAADPDRLRAKVTARIRTHRQRRALLISAGTAVGAAAVGVPAFLWLGREPKTYPVGEGISLPLHVRPTWIPDGTVAHSRAVNHVSPLWESQLFATPGFDSNPQTVVVPGSVGVLIYVEDLSGAQPLGGAPSTDVNGSPAVVASTRESTTSVQWTLADGLIATVSAIAAIDPDARLQMALRVARGLVTDGLTSVAIALRFADMDDPAFTTVEVGGTPDNWRQQLVSPRASATLTSTRPQGGDGEPATIRGRSGTVAAGGQVGHDTGLTTPPQLRVQLDDGRWLWVQAVDLSDTGGRDLVIEIAETMTIGPNPDLSWLGRGV
jgi:hypothetical protein